MMANFSEKSKEKLKTCDEDLQDLLNAVVENYDCIILEGHRSDEKQQELFKEGKTKVKFSKHNCKPSRAVDVSPYPIPDNWGRIPYGLLQNKEDKEHLKRAIKELCEMYRFNGYVKGVADRMNIPTRSGADWDGDNELNDQKFDDIMHWELL